MFNWITKLFGANRNPNDDFWYSSIPTGLGAGVEVTPETALKVPAVRDCLQVLADPIASLPLQIFRRVPGGKERVDDHPLFDILHYQPNENMTASEFRGQMQWNLALYNNAYAEILPGPRGAIDQLIPLHPGFVNPRRTNGQVWYEYHDQDIGSMRPLNQSEIWHLRALPLSHDGLCGMPRINNASDTVSQALAVQQYGARYFANDGQAGGIIKHPGAFKDADVRDQFLRAWRAARTGGNAHRDAVLEYGMDYQRFSVQNDQAQFLETRKEMAVEIARIWKIPPHKIGILDRATFSNIEQQSLEFVMDTMLPWFVLWEQAIRRDLIINQDTFFAEFNVAGLLRGDLKTRYEAYSQGRQWGWLSINDVRRLENMNPIGTGGDDYLQPMNMQPAGSGEQASSVKVHQTIPDSDKQKFRQGLRLVKSA